MRSVEQYTLAGYFGAQSISMPKGARVLSVHATHESACVWALGDPHAPMEKHRFGVVPTGEEWQSDDEEALGSFIGTVHLRGGTYVVHIFDMGPEKVTGQ